MLLSLLPPSCMVAPNRGLVNTQFSFDISSTSNSQAHLNTLNMENDIEMGPPRGRSHINLSNSSRDSSIISTTSFKLYYKHIEIQNNNPSWFNQIEDEYNACSLDTNIGKSNISSSSVSGNNLKNKQ